MDQNDIDALMNQMPEPDDDSSTGAGDAAPQSAPEPAPEKSADGVADVGVGQGDIDALMAEAQQLAEEPVTAASGDAESAPPAEVALDSTGRPLDEAGAAMAAEQAAPVAQAQPPAPNLPVEAVTLPDFDVTELAKQANQPLSLLYDVEMHVKIELGRTQMYVEDILKLGQGSVVELDRFAGDPVDVYVNGRMVARGEVLVLNDCFCVRVSEIVSNPDARLAG